MAGKTNKTKKGNINKNRNVKEKEMVQEKEDLFAQSMETQATGKNYERREKKQGASRGNRVTSQKHRKAEEGELTRQQIRRKRRIRNQTICFFVLIVFVGSVVFFGIWGTKQIMNGFRVNSYNINSGIVLEQEGADTDLVDVDTVVVETETEEYQEVYERDELDDLVDVYLQDMSLEDKISQMFIITPEALTQIPGTATVAGPKTEAALQEKAIGGVLFQSANFADPTKAKDMVTKTYTLAKKPLFTTLYEAGGGSGTLSGNSSMKVPATDSFAAIGASQDASKAYEAGVTIGGYLKEFGFTLDLSAVCDLETDASFGSDPSIVADMVSNYVTGLQSTGVHACLMSFPGTSGLTTGEGGGAMFTELTLDELRQSAFIPFKAGIDAGAEFVMVSHIADVNVTGGYTQASMSPIFITDVLRNELGFRGVVITDRLDKSVITNYLSTSDAVVMAVDAGADILLCPDDYDVAYHALLSAVQDGTISEERINESLHRIYRVKLSGTSMSE